MGALQVIWSLCLCLLDLKTCYTNDNVPNAPRTLSVASHTPSKCTLHTYTPTKEFHKLSQHGLKVDFSLVYLFLVKEKFCYFNVKSFDSLKCLSEDEISKHVWQRRLILLMLLMAGNVQSNPGPEPECLYVPSEFSSHPGLKVVHLNVCSLMPKIDYIRIWAMSTKADIIAISETWLKKTLSDNDIATDGYNIFRVDGKSKGGGVVIYVNCKLNAILTESMTVPKCFEMLAIDLTLGNTRLTVACCYRPFS